MFEPNIFVKKPFSNGTGNPAITYGYNINNYNNPFGNPSTSLGFEGSVTIPNYLDFVNQTVNAAVNAAIGAVTGGANYSQNTGSSGGSDGGTSNLQPTGINLQNALNVVKEPDMKAFQLSVEHAIRKATNLDFDLSTPEEESFSDKFNNSTFGKNFGAWSAGIGLANNLFTTFAGEKDEYSGAKGGLARGIDRGYDAILSTVGMLGPIGQAASLIMGGNKLLGNVMNKIGGGTSGMTTTDAILNSSFLQLTPLGLINGFGGKKAMTITKDNQAFAQVGSSYSGTNFAVDDALSKSGKKYGLFSLGARDKANREILDARRLQLIMANIADTASDRFALSDSMAAINNSRMALNLMGGYDQSSIRVGKAGMVLQLAREINSRLSNSMLQEVTDIPEEFLEVPEFKEGGLIPLNYEILKEVTEIPAEFLEIDEFKKGGKFNIIPEGALHARRHNMDVENITLKGIPVVSESADGEIVQQAEIERLEIIFRLEVTKKLEELAKDGSDEAAIEAGKLLVQEIIYNTIDNTNTLL